MIRTCPRCRVLVAGLVPGEPCPYCGGRLHRNVTTITTVPRARHADAPGRSTLPLRREEDRPEAPRPS